MLLFLFLLGLALGPVSPSEDLVVDLQGGSCPTFWSLFTGRCYKYIATHLTWADAELHCVSLGANLVSIHSDGEDEFVKSLIKNFDITEGLTWIGLSDVHKEGSWMWSDGSPAIHFLWEATQPDNSKRKDHCVNTNYNAPRKWNDDRCYKTYPSVCATRAIFA
ncbi:lactose-binding lectin l-2-like [Eleginops maclovinus]|uniref:lactose-binding lectin l-2-like n=1 Tax=Eleginops maclovinus TaxID=56733 RepID=UPI003080E9BB